MLDRLVFFGLVLLIVLTPLAFGTTELWSMTALQLGVAALSGLYFSGQILKGRLAIPNPRLALLFAAFVLWVCLQIVPWPFDNGARVMSLISGATTPWPFPFKRPTLSVYPYATQQALRALLSYLSVFLLATSYFARGGGAAPAAPRRFFGITALANVIIFFAGALAVFAIVQHFMANQLLYTFPAGSSPFGPFVNRNHYAGYMELTIPLVLAFIFVKDLRPEMLVLYGMMAMLMTASLFLSLSRSGIAIFIGQLVVFAGLLRLAGCVQTPRLKRYFLPFALALIAVSVFWLSFEPLVSRFVSLSDPNSTEAGAPNRWAAWKDTLRIARDFPLTGTGLGTFAYVFPLYKSVAGKWEAAHNDYLQVFGETGVIGLGLILLFSGLALTQAVRRIRAEPSRRAVAVRIGALTSCFGILLHSITDFNLQVPSNALLFFVLLAVATVDVRSGVRSPSDAPTIHPSDSNEPVRAGFKPAPTLRSQL